MYKILSVSRNTRLLLRRNDTLSLAGFRVVSPRSPEDAPNLAKEQEVDAVIIGHSVESPIRASIIGELRRVCPQCPIFFVYADPIALEESLADISLDVTEGPEPLILELQRRLPRPDVAAD